MLFNLYLLLCVQCFTGKHDFTVKSDRDKSTTGAPKIYENINQSGGTLNDEIGEPSSLENFPAKQASGCMSTPWRTSQGRFSLTEKVRILERVLFDSEKPFFKLLMQPTYVGSKCDRLVSFSVYDPAIYFKMFFIFS